MPRSAAGARTATSDRRCMTHELWASLNAHIFTFLRSRHAGGPRRAAARARARRRPSCRTIARRSASPSRPPSPDARRPRCTTAMKLPIYLDYSATTPVDPRVAAEDDPVAHRRTSAIRPRARTRSAGAPRRRSRRRAARSRRWSTATRRNSSGPRARPNRSTSRSRAPRTSTRTRAGTSSRSRPSTRPRSTRCASSSARASRSPTSTSKPDGLLDLDMFERSAAPGHDRSSRSCSSTTRSA